MTGKKGKSNSEMYALCGCGSGEKYKFCCYDLKQNARVNMSDVQLKIQGAVKKIVRFAGLYEAGGMIESRFTDCYMNDSIFFIRGKCDVALVKAPLQPADDAPEREKLKFYSETKFEDYEIVNLTKGESK
jgi:hypothetical protein